MPSFLDPKHQFHLTVAISIAIAQWLESLLHRHVKIKWPNDIYVGDRKIGGVLIENILKGSVWKSAAIGIGINVNQVAFPDTIDERITSIKQILHRDCDPAELLTDLCQYIERAYTELKKGANNTLLTRYKQYLYRLGELHPFLVDGVRVNGVLSGVTESGRLQVDFNGHTVDFDIKEIAFVI